MAAGEGVMGVPQLGGYSYDFLSEVPDRLTCCICQLTLKDPVQVPNCGHRFCRLCIDSVFKGLRQERCPVDREPISKEKLFADAACEREVKDLRVKCPNQGCLWNGELREVENHEETCQFKLVKCINPTCPEKVQRSKLLHHVKETCVWRKVSCTHCLEIYIWNSSKIHKELCKRYPLPCPSHCGKSIPRELMERHLQTFCPRAIIPCKYQHIGCKVKVQRSAVQIHIKEDVEKHLDLACSKIKEMNSVLFTWRITNFSKHLQKARYGREVSLDSEPFHTSPDGYKMKVRIYPNGFDVEKNSHMTVFIIMMKGDYDSILTWPFLPNITFSLIDQQQESERNNIVKVIEVKPTFKNFLKPVTQQNRGRGVPRFVTHEQLYTRQYIVDDTIFIQVKVELPVE